MTNTTTLLTTRRVLAISVVIGIASLITACQGPQQAAVQRAMNADRQANRMRALPINYEAQAKAQAWAERLARENRLYHSRLSDGIRSRWCNLGENVGYGSSIAAVEKAYMKSPGHRANILSSKWNGVGTGYAVRGTRVYTVHVFIRTC